MTHLGFRERREFDDVQSLGVSSFLGGHHRRRQHAKSQDAVAGRLPSASFGAAGFISAGLRRARLTAGDGRQGGALHLAGACGSGGGDVWLGALAGGVGLTSAGAARATGEVRCPTSASRCCSSCRWRRPGSLASESDAKSRAFGTPVLHMWQRDPESLCSACQWAIEARSSILRTQPEAASN